jgi:hypothetical protein
MIAVKAQDWKQDIVGRTPEGGPGLEIPYGWDSLIEELHGKIKLLFPDYEVHQIKEKFGTLRYYCSVSADPVVRVLIDGAEKSSAVTCQECGAPGQTYTDQGPVSTQCVGHHTPKTRGYIYDFSAASRD